MEPKEKAEELVYKFKYESKHYLMLDAEKCSLIAVEEILNTLYSIPFGNALDNELEYWEEVKQEIKNK
jgi:hypothetical protein